MSLIQSGKIPNYLIYALGEIALVVIGILIALQINNWNENRKSRILEAAFLSDINTEFKANKIQFERTVNGHKEQARRCQLIIEQFPIVDENWDSISNIYLLNPNTPTKQTEYGSSYLEFVPTFNPSQSSIESLISSSSFDIVKDKELKSLLISWKDLFLDYQENEIKESGFIEHNLEPFRLEHTRLIKGDDDRFIMKLSPDRRYMFESLIRQRRSYLGIFVNDNLGEIALVRETIDSIIALTEPYVNKKE
jgi:hypothetical protein